MSRVTGIIALQEIAPLRTLLEGADHIDVKTVRGRSTLREFISRMLGYQPWWLRGLFSLRRWLARALGLEQIDLDHYRVPEPQDVPFVRGTVVGPGRIVVAEEDRIWATRIADRHLEAVLAVVVERVTGGLSTFHFVTIVRFLHWTGPLYFNAIRPFHHLVVLAMARAGVGPARARLDTRA